MIGPGSRIAVISPAGTPREEHLEANCQLIRSWGLEPVRRQNRSHLYFSAPDEERLEELHWALNHPEIAAVWASRGGYGLTRLLPRLQVEGAQRPVIGFSDLTALHVALWQRGWQQLVHGPVLHSLGQHPDEASRQALKELLLQGRAPVLPGRTLVQGNAQGPLVGGNLCVLACLCGTDDQLDAHGAILLLEDVHEKPYRLDRYLVQLINSGVLEGVVGVALGSFEDCQPPQDEPWSVHEVLEPLLRSLGVPVLTHVPVGHGRENLPFVYGAPVRLEEGRLIPVAQCH